MLTYLRYVGHGRRSKVFCIGQHKTGTTSMKKALKDLAYNVGKQAPAELLIHDYARRNFQPIIRFCYVADAFQDIPFCLPYTYQVLDHAFPGSKFILTVRDNVDEWYDSLIRFQRERLGVQGQITKEDLLNDSYRYKGFSWEAIQIMYDTPEQDPYNEKILKKNYVQQNEAVINYFKFKDNLLVINLKEEDSYRRFCAFLGVEAVYEAFPWLNRSR